MRKHVTDYETREVKEEITDYETAEVDREVLICDMCHRKAEQLTNVYFGIDIDKPNITSFIRSSADSAKHFKDRGVSSPHASMRPGPKVNTYETELTGINEFDNIPPSEIREIDLHKSFISLADLKTELKSFRRDISVTHEAKRELCESCLDELEIKELDDHNVVMDKREYNSLHNVDIHEKIIDGSQDFWASSLMIVGLSILMTGIIIELLIWVAMPIIATGLLLHLDAKYHFL